MNKIINCDIKKINESIDEIEKLLKESMNFCEDDSIEEPSYGEEPFEDEMADEPIGDDSIESDEIESDEIESEGVKSIESYVDHIRKYSLNGLSALCDEPESEEYQMLKKIFQMCDKKPEKKDGLTESHRLFGILKENKKVIFETNVSDKRNFNAFKNTLISEAIAKGYDPSDIRLVSESKIIR
jgi:hypothetical protein